MAHFQHTCNACLKPICEGDVYITRCGHRFCERPRDRDLLASSPSSLLAPLPSSRARARRLTTSAPPAVCTQATTTREGCVRRASARRAARRCTGRRISRCGACPDRPTPSCAFFEPLFQPSGVRRSAWRRGQRGPPRVRPGHDHDVRLTASTVRAGGARPGDVVEEVQEGGARRGTSQAPRGAPCTSGQGQAEALCRTAARARQKELRASTSRRARNAASKHPPATERSG